MYEQWINLISLSMQMSWLHGIVEIVFVIFALIFVYNNVIKPCYTYISRFSKSFYKLLDISSQFENNGGSTMRDKIDLIVKTVKETKTAVNITDGKVLTVMGILGSTIHGVGMYEADSKGGYISVTRKWSEITETSAGESEGNGWVNSIAEKDRERVFTAWNNAISQNRDFNLEYELHNGVKIVNHADVIRDENGLALRFVGTIIPIIEKLSHGTQNPTL